MLLERGDEKSACRKEKATIDLTLVNHDYLSSALVSENHPFSSYYYFFKYLLLISTLLFLDLRDFGFG